MKFLVACLVSVGIAYIADVAAKVFSPHGLWWNNSIWWMAGATSMFLTAILISRMG